MININLFLIVLYNLFEFNIFTYKSFNYYLFYIIYIKDKIDDLLDSLL